MKDHFCPVEKEMIGFEGVCNWCGAKEESTGWRKRTIMEMAREAGFERLGHTDYDWVCYPEDIEAFAKLVAQAERKEWEKEFAGMGQWACVYLLEERNR